MKPLHALSGTALILMLCACGPDEVQSGTLQTKAALQPGPAPSAHSSCFSDAEGLRLIEGGALVDATGLKLFPLPLFNKVDIIAASSEDFCGKWASQAQSESNMFQYVFRTNENCIRRALPGDFVHLGVDMEDEATEGFVTRFVACQKPGISKDLEEPSTRGHDDPLTQ